MRWTRPARTGLAASLLAAALAVAGPALGDEEAPRGGAGAPKEETVELDEAAASVTGALQGKEAVRIQTLCTHCNSANIQVGGLAAELVPMELGGFPLLGGMAVAYALNCLPPDTVAEAQVVKGPGSADLPNPAAGGTISLEPSEPSELPYLTAGVLAGTYRRRSAVVRLAGEAAPWLSGQVLAGTDRADPVDDDGDGFNDVGRLDREFAELRAHIAAAERHELELGASWQGEDVYEGRGGYDSRLGGPGSPAWTREDTLIDRREYRAGYRWRFRRGGALSVRLLESRRRQIVISQLTADPSSPFSDLFPRYRIADVIDWGQVRFDRPLGLAWRISAGVEGESQRVEAVTVADFTGSIQDAVDRVKTRSVFVKAGRSARRWDLDFGLRYDDDAFFGSQLSPRATLRWFPAEGLTLRVLGGRTFRVPRPIFSEVCCGQRYQRNTSTRAETGTTYALEAVYQPSPVLRASVYASRTDFDDYILRWTGFTTEYVATLVQTNVPEARANTLELALRYRPVDALTLDGSIGWLDFRARGPALTEIGIELDPVNFPGVKIPFPIPPLDRIPFQPVRTGSLAARWTPHRRVTVSAQASYTGTMLIQRYAPGSFVPVAAYVETPGFWQVNVALEARLNRWLVLGAGADNVTGRLQNDLGDPATDYNWGPLAGRSWFLNLRAELSR